MNKRDLLVLYSDDLNLRKDTWEWIVQKADNTYVCIILSYTSANGYETVYFILGIANKNVTSLSSAHCSAPSAWPFIGDTIGFSQF